MTLGVHEELLRISLGECDWDKEPFKSQNLLIMSTKVLIQKKKSI